MSDLVIGREHEFIVLAAWRALMEKPQPEPSLEGRTSPETDLAAFSSPIHRTNRSTVSM